MGLNRYEIFVKVAELGSITRAAEALHYTQAGVSHAVAALERETGATLLVRSPGGVSLTESGKRLLPPIQTLVNDRRALEQAVLEINGTVAGTLRVGTFTSVSTQWLPGIIRGFQARYPKVEFELLGGDYDEITERLLTARTDCGFLSAPVADGLLFQSLYQDPMLVILPPDHPLKARESLRLEDIQGEPLILPMKGSDNDNRAVLRDTRWKEDVRYVLNDDYSVLSMVAHGFGVSIMPELILRNCRFDLTIRPLDPPRFRNIGIASLPAERTSVLTRTFLRYLAEPGNLDYAALT